tara:strand:+ start:1812 stop:2714 length:903 start_codon:yes stop_codon:yes gene_type:complete
MFEVRDDDTHSAMAIIHQGDVRDVLPTLDDASVQCVVTSPPYWGLRDYGVDGQIGLEPTPDAYVQTLVAVFREIKRVLRDDGTVWLNLGDSYNGVGRGSKAKDLIGMPWRVAFALKDDGWYLRSDIIWAKGVSFCLSYSGSVMPESVTDRPTKSHEYLFLLTKSPRYYYDVDAVRELSTSRPQSRATATSDQPGAEGRRVARGQNPTCQGGTGTSRNLRSVWTINPQPYREAHFATFPTALVEPCVNAGTKKGDTVLDPFAGSGTVGCVALALGRTFVGIELNPDYCTMARESINGPLFA